MHAEVPWWRSAVVYQIYPRSFADGNGDGIGDLRGMIDRLDHLADLGVDAVWVSPWYPSPMADGGYDVSDYRDIAPEFGTLADADEFVAKAHALGLRVFIDLVPNHTSEEHPWFQAALAAGPGSPERERYVFRDGTGPDGSQPPSNWGSIFGGGAWERVDDGQWYLHTFARQQPDLNWDNEEVRAEFDDILRFWFDRGIDGFRIDVADSMAIDTDLPPVTVDPSTGFGTLDKYVGNPQWDQPALEAIHKRWRAVADEYAGSPQGPRVFVSEAYLSPIERLTRFVKRDRLHTTFNFEFLNCAWESTALRCVIDSSLQAHDAVGAPTTWVLSNHDTVRHATRYGKPYTGAMFREGGTMANDWMDSHEQNGRKPTDLELGRRRARAAALLELALPGGAYIYQGDELGLEEVEDVPDDLRQDPVAHRTDFPHKGRDGCRVPIPWTTDGPSLGFGDVEPWLPQPPAWAGMSVQAQADDPSSFLALYKRALRLRHELPALGDGTLQWQASDPDVLDFTRAPGFRCVLNLSGDPVELPAGKVILASDDVSDGFVPVDGCAWIGTITA